MAGIPLANCVLGGLPETRLLDFADPRATHVSLREIGTTSKDPPQILDNFFTQGWFYDSPGDKWLAMGMEVLLDIYGQGDVKMPPSVETKKTYLNVDIGLKSSVDFYLHDKSHSSFVQRVGRLLDQYCTILLLGRSYAGNKNTGPLDFDAICQLLLKEDKRSDKTYNLLNLISGGLPTVPESVESSHDTPWVIRPAIFSCHVQSIIHISEAAINPPVIVKKLEELQALGIKGDVTKIPHVSLSGSNDMKSSLFCYNCSGQESVPLSDKQSEDLLRSGNNITALLNPPAAGSRSKLMTGITVSSVGPTISTDTLGKFDVSLISEAELFDLKSQPFLPSQASLTYGIPMKRTLDMRPGEHDLQFSARWGLERPKRRAAKLPRVKESASKTNKRPSHLWDEVAEYWSDNNKSDIRCGVAQAATAIFGWDDDAFADIFRKPVLLLAQFEDIYLAPPHTSAPVAASNGKPRQHIESHVILGAENKWTPTVPCIINAHVRFGKPFDFPPVIHSGIPAFDFAGSNSPKMLIQSENITQQGFQMNMQSWDYTIAKVSWLAFDSDAQGVQSGVREFSDNRGWTAETPLNNFRHPPKAFFGISHLNHELNNLHKGTRIRTQANSVTTEKMLREQ
ncbi:hypothetical protein FDENT_8946 [Fusarium denticulatum]|uniref:H-type lectin domain-containing protein n=1 Tax=Fusarium denticulatum TaxID=48507 RepID=A0A8H5TZN2_9HYPO|nr:hypothetical protein FDENT_8946 [Fusarium denticulatum]